jgi:hypothetical protein
MGPGLPTKKAEKETEKIKPGTSQNIRTAQSADLVCIS